MAEKSPETWLQSELSELLVNIHDALDAWSRLPSTVPGPEILLRVIT